MSRPETLERKYAGKLPPDAQAFMCSLLALDPSDRLTCTECMQVCGRVRLLCVSLRCHCCGQVARVGRR